MESASDSIMFQFGDDSRAQSCRLEESTRPTTAPVRSRSQVGDPTAMMDARTTFYNAMDTRTKTSLSTSVYKC
jgi:hypothetical protein